MSDRVLNSWKEIAQFVGRGVRTVQRWERELGLPVRRPRGRAKSPVLALASELDQWMAASPCRNSDAGCDRPSLVQPTLPVVAVVDDNDIQRYILASGVARRGFSVIEASSGEAALRLFASIRPDVALIDLQLPDIDGYELCRRVKRGTPLSRTAVLIHTAFDDTPAARHHAERAGANAFFAYPTDVEELISSIARWVRRDLSLTRSAA